MGVTAAGAKIKVNAKDLKKYQNSLKKMNKAQLQMWNETAVRELAARLLAKVIKRTPVGIYPAGSGKTGGTLRRGWSIGNVKKNGGTYSVEVINPTEYAPYVEFGHRKRGGAGWVGGRFMLTISEQELQADAPGIMMNKLKTFMGGVFK